MTSLLSIRKLRLVDVHAVVREAVQTGLDPDVMSDFLARVDWSFTTGRLTKVESLVGKLEHWDTEYAEGDIDKDEYRKRLVSLLPDDAANPRSRRSPVSA
jgi:hypothetical protein